MKIEINPLFERFLLGFKLGLHLGSQNGLRREQHLILRQLKKCVKKLSEAVIERINTLPQNKLESLGEDLLDFKLPSDLTRWLRKNAPANPRHKNGAHI